MRLIAVIILIFYSCLSAGQSSNTSTRYSVNEGLSDNRVYSMVQDERGFIWIATQNGLNRFDGKSFTIFNSSNSGLKHNVVYEIIKGPSDYLFLATRFGACLLNTQTGIIKHFQAPSTPELVTIANDVRHIDFTSQKELILGSEGGIYIFNLNGEIVAKHEAQFDPGEIGIKRLFFTLRLSSFTDGSALIATTDGYFYYNSKTKKIQRVETLPENYNPLKKFINKHGASYVYEINKKDQLFFIDFKAHIDSLFILDNKSNQLNTTALPFSTWDNIRWDSKIHFHSDSLITITTSRNGYFVYNYNNTSSQLNLISGFNATNTFCQYILLDKRGHFWIGTEQGILQETGSNTSITNTTIVPFVEKDSYHPVTTIYTSKNRIWLGAFSKNSGLIVLDKNYQFLKRIDLKKDDSVKNYIISISPWSEDTLLIGTRSGAYFLNKNTYAYSPFLIKKFDKKVSGILIAGTFQASNGETWLSGGQSGGAWKINKEKDAILHFKPGKNKYDFPLRNASSFAEDKNGNIWMMNWVDGLTRWNTKKQFFDTVIRQWPLKAVNGFNCAGMVIDKKGDFWFFINSYGLIKYDLEKNIVTRLAASTDQADDNTDGLLLTNERYIWMNLRHSILVYDILTGKLTSFTSKNGLPNEINSSIQLEYDSDTKQVLIGFINNISSIPTDVFKSNIYNEKLFITGVKSINEDVYIDFTKPITLSHKSNNLRIDFSVIDYTKLLPEPLFEYQLNETGSWIYIGSQSSLNLNNLAPGEYNLQIRETGLNSVNNQKIASLIFIIKPPFHKTIWFYLAISAMIALSFYGIYQNRIRQLKNIHAVREKIASDLHDDIGSRLTNISLLSVIGNDINVPSGERKNYLKKISEEVMASGEALDEIVHNMHLHDEELQDITTRMRRYASESFDNGFPVLKMLIDDKISTRKLEMEKKRDLFLIFKEIINNIKKHAEAKAVNIEIGSAGKMLVLQIKDDGKGFNPDEFTDRNGLRNIKARIAKWKGKVEIISEINKGTQFNIHLPFDKGSYLKRIFGSK